MYGVLYVLYSFLTDGSDHREYMLNEFNTFIAWFLVVEISKENMNYIQLDVFSKTNLKMLFIWTNSPANVEP